MCFNIFLVFFCLTYPHNTITGSSFCIVIIIVKIKWFQWLTFKLNTINNEGEKQSHKEASSTNAIYQNTESKSEIK